MTAQPVAVKWTEAQGKAIVLTRNGGVCERCNEGRATDFAHRKRRSQGGTWSPANGCGLCRRCHDWCGDNPDAAKAGGWEVPGHGDPEETPVWLWHEYIAGWWLLSFLEDGDPYRSHVLVPVDAAEWGLPQVPEGAP